MPVSTDVTTSTTRPASDVRSDQYESGFRDGRNQVIKSQSGKQYLAYMEADERDKEHKKNLQWHMKIQNISSIAMAVGIIAIALVLILRG